MVGEDGEVVQAADYLPSGITTTEYNGLTADNHLHTGKEFDSMHGLHWYDNGARWMDPIFHRFTTMDPLAEKYYGISPYAVCANNPLKYTDPDGRKLIIGSSKNKPFWSGKDDFTRKVEKQWKMNKMDSHAIEYIAGEIENSEYEYRIRPLEESPNKEAIENGNHVIPDSSVELGKKQGATLYYDPDSESTWQGKRDPRIGLAHEMGHFKDLMDGTARSADTGKARAGDKIEKYKVELNEATAIDLENIIRRILDYGERDGYFLEF